MKQDYDFEQEAASFCDDHCKPKNQREGIIAVQAYLNGVKMGQGAYKMLVSRKDLFNTLFKEGTKMIVVDDFGIEHERILESSAFILGGHTAVAKFSDIGIYDLSRVRLKKVYKNGK